MEVKSKMKNKLGICLAIAGVLLLGSCAVTDMSSDVDFNQYKTFGWGKAQINVNSPAYKSGLISSKIRKATKDEFEKHGLTYTKNKPDLLVSYQTFTQDKEQVSAGYYGGRYPMMFPGMWYGGWGPMWGYPYGPYGAYGAPMYRYTEGTLIIDITDAKTNELVWRGLVKGNVSDLSSLQKSISKGVKAIVKKYPGAVDPNRDSIDVPKRKVS